MAGGQPTPAPTQGVDWGAELAKVAQGGGTAPGQATPGLGVTNSEANYYKVYLGSAHDEFHSEFAGKDLGKAGQVPSNKAATERITDVDSAAGSIYTWSDKRLKKWEQTLLDNGLIEPGKYNYEDLVGKWQAAVDAASKLYTIGNKKVTPEQYVEMYVGKSGIGGTSSTGPTTTTNTTYQHVDDLDARGAANDAYSSLLGRRASGKEANALQAALNAYAEAHPSMVTTTDDGKGHTVNRPTGGLSSDAAQQIAEDQIKAKPHYAEFQAATTVHNWLQQAIGPASPGY